MDGAERRAEGGWRLGRRGLMTGSEGGLVFGRDCLLKYSGLVL